MAWDRRVELDRRYYFAVFQTYHVNSIRDNANITVFTKAGKKKSIISLNYTLKLFNASVSDHIQCYKHIKTKIKLMNKKLSRKLSILFLGCARHYDNNTNDTLSVRRQCHQGLEV